MTVLSFIVIFFPFLISEAITQDAFCKYSCYTGLFQKKWYLVYPADFWDTREIREM